MDKKYFIDKVEEINKNIDSLISQKKSIFCTSSFQQQSLPLLHILSNYRDSITVYITNTGFLFPETITFADEICNKFDIKLEMLESDTPKINQRSKNGEFLYATDPNFCCKINKVLPLEKTIASHDIWINGVRSDQSSFRKELETFEKTQFSCIRYHPMLDWTAKDIFYYNKIFKMPRHPLDEIGYSSIGCEPCTVRSFNNGSERNSRWFGMNKTECGINTDLIAKG